MSETPSPYRARPAVRLTPLRNISDLSDGTIVRHRVTGDAYIVIQAGKKSATVVRSININNPDEWHIVQS